MGEGTRGATSAQIGAVAEEVPSSHLPPVTYQDLPDPLPLRKVLGPGVVSIGIGVSSGELIIWPFITSQIGLIFLWAAVIGVRRRFCFTNIEVPPNIPLTSGGTSGRSATRSRSIL